MASSALVVLKVPATARPMARLSLSNPSASHCCPSQMASTPYAAVDMATAQATFLASLRGVPLAPITRASVLILWCSSARRCLTCACQLNFGSRKKPSHVTGLALMLNLRLTTWSDRGTFHLRFHPSAFFLVAVLGLGPVRKWYFLICYDYPVRVFFYISLVRITCYGIAWKRMESCGFFTTTWKPFIGRT
jgi:hypothetical protein